MLKYHVDSGQNSKMHGNMYGNMYIYQKLTKSTSKLELLKCDNIK